jgi:hypothetical protein
MAVEGILPLMVEQAANVEHILFMNQGCILSRGSSAGGIARAILPTITAALPWDP